ncbi:NOLC1 protein, partial [Urocolius indicus]|nr:NOLC1 protein [Urocolius indicus]
TGQYSAVPPPQATQPKKGLAKAPAKKAESSDSSDSSNEEEQMWPINYKLSFAGKAVAVKTTPVPQKKAVTSKKAESSSDSDSDSSSEDDKKKVGSKLPAKAPVTKNTSKPEKAAVKPGKAKKDSTATPAAKKPQVATKKAQSSSDSDSSSEDEKKMKKGKGTPAKLAGKMGKPASKPSTPAPKAATSDSDSSSSEEEEEKGKKPAVKPATKPTGAAKSAVGKKAAASSSSSSSDSSSEEDEKPKKAGKGAQNSSKTTASTEKAKASTPAANNLKSKPAGGSSSSSESSSEEETGKVNGGITYNTTGKKQKREDAQEPETPHSKKAKIKAKTPHTVPKVKRVSEAGLWWLAASPFRRVREEEIEVDARVADNSFEAKKGAAGDWGEKANNILKFTKGKSFRHEKTKKKRGSYRGGSISTQVNSVKFESD